MQQVELQLPEARLAAIALQWVKHAAVDNTATP
jgi:hypothetical protein